MKVTPSKALAAESANLLGITRLGDEIFPRIASTVENHAVMLDGNGDRFDDITEAFGYEERYPDDPVMKDIMYRSLALNTILRTAGLSDLVDDEDAKPVYQALLANVAVLDPADTENDPYFRRIRIPDAERDGYAIGHETYCAGEYCLYDIPVFEGMQYRLCIPRIGVFARTLSYPVAKKDGYAWMSVTPNEINTMAGPVAHAAGKVLTLGLGLGYFAYMAHAKPDVESVTVVEHDPGCIALFREHILPQFDHPGKIEIIEGDAVEFIRTVDDGAFDYCFADIWDSGMDWKPYLAVKTAARRLRRTKTDFWIEDSLVWYISSALIPVFTKDMTRAARLDMDEHMAAEAAMTRDQADMTAFMRRLTSQETVKTPSDLRELFTVKRIRELLKKRKTVNWPPDGADT